jgi:alpha-tubulin suppressor-like RCC1 family protein
MEDADLPQVVKALEDKFVTKVAAGGFHTLAVTKDDEIYSWGSGTYGELGLGNQQSVCKPQMVKM